MTEIVCLRNSILLVVYYEEIKRELKRILIHGRCNERLKSKTEGPTRLEYTGLRGGLEHLKIETRLRGERFESVTGVRSKLFFLCVFICNCIKKAKTEGIKMSR